MTGAFPGSEGLPDLSRAASVVPFYQVDGRAEEPLEVRDVGR